MQRRQFLVRSGLLVGMAPLGARVSSGNHHVTAPPPDFESWESIRDQFRIDRSFVHMSAFFLASHPRSVREAIERHREGLDANPIGYWLENEVKAEQEVLSAASQYLGVQPVDIALTDSTTMGLGLLYSGLILRPGQEVLYTAHDHYSTEVSLQHRTARDGISVRRITLYSDPARASVSEIIDSLTAAVTPRTRVIAVTWVHSSTGVKLPIRVMADALARINADRDEADRVLLCVDGVHGLGAEDVSLPELGCDFFIAGTHKWMFGPRGTGIVWGRPEAWPMVKPVIPTFDAATYEMWMKIRDPEPIPVGATMTPGGFHSFEHRWALNEAFLFHMKIGKERVMHRIHELNRQLKEGLAAMPHVTLHTPMDDELSAGIVCFELQNLSPLEAVDKLYQRKIVASFTPYATLYARLSPGLLTTPEDVEQTLREVHSLGLQASQGG